MKTFPRKIEKFLLKEVEKPQIVVITGMRQVGKTTLLKRIFEKIESENKIFVDLENPLNQKLFEESNYENILLNLKEFGLNLKEKIYLFVDEIQLMPEVVKPIKYLYDHYKIKFFLTGSSSFYLKGLFPESLAGRKIIYELYPLTFGEFLAFKNKRRKFIDNFKKKAETKNKINYELYKTLYEEYLEFGGFPGVVLEEDYERKKMLLGDIFKSYFEKDVKTIADFRNINILRDMILLLGARCGSKIEITKISSELGISRDTVYSYLNFLEKTYFISLISPFSKSINGEVRGSKKIYFRDTGILNYLVKIPEGNIFENAVFNSLKQMGKVNYYQRYKGPEIDFIVNQKIAFEVKINAIPSDIKRFKKISEKLGLKEFYIITKNYVDIENTILGIDL